MSDSIQTMTFEESVKKRPFMYIGNNGLTDLFKGIILNCISLTGSDAILFTLSVLTDKNFVFEGKSNHSLNSFIEAFDSNSFSSNYFPRVLKILSSKFELSGEKEKYSAKIAFELDTTVLRDSVVDFQKLSEMAFLIASLNRGTEILVQDSRDRYLNQVYYHFREGIKYLYKRAKEDSLGKPEFEVIFNGKVKNLDYQIFLGYRTDWYPQPFIISFANDVTTICGGSLVAGIMDGMIAACKKYVIEEGLETYKIKRKKFNN